MSDEDARPSEAPTNVIPLVDATQPDLYSGGMGFGAQFGVYSSTTIAGAPVMTSLDVFRWDPLSLRWHFMQRRDAVGAREQWLAVQSVNDYDGVYESPIEGDSPYGQPESFSPGNRSTREVDARGRVALPSSQRMVIDSEDKRHALAWALAEIPMSKASSQDPVEAAQAFVAGEGVRILDDGARIEFGAGDGKLGGAVIFSGPAAQAALRAIDRVRKAGGTPKQAAQAGATEAAKYSGGGGALKAKGGQQASAGKADGQSSDQLGFFGIGNELLFDFVDTAVDTAVASFFGIGGDGK